MNSTDDDTSSDIDDEIEDDEDEQEAIANEKSGPNDDDDKSVGDDDVNDGMETLEASFLECNEDDGDGDDDCQIIEAARLAAAGPRSSSTVDLTLRNHPPTRQVSQDSSNSASSYSTSKRSKKVTENPSSSSSSAAESTNETHRLSKIAKRYKRRCKQQQSKLRDAAKKLTTLREQLGSAKDDLKNKIEELEDIKESQTDNELELDGANLKIIRLQRDLENVTESHAVCIQTLNTTKAKLEHFERNYQKDLAKKSATSMTEVTKMADDNRRLVEENQRYKELVGQLRSCKSSSSEGSNTIGKIGNVKKPSMRQLAKNLKQMDDVRQIAKSSHNKKRQSSESSTTAAGRKRLDATNMTKYSAQTARYAKKATQRGGAGSANSSFVNEMISASNLERKRSIGSDSNDNKTASSRRRNVLVTRPQNTSLGSKGVNPAKRKPAPPPPRLQPSSLSGHATSTVMPSLNLSHTKQKRRKVGGSDCSAVGSSSKRDIRTFFGK